MFIYIFFIWLGNPKPHLRPLKEHLSTVGHALKRKRLSKIWFDIICKSLVIICQYLHITDINYYV